MKIFQNKDKKFSELKESFEGRKSFDLEKTIQGIIEKNLGEFFTDLEFVKTEHQIDDLRPDTIAYDKERKSFTIIEYKNKQDKSLIEQGISYYQLLQEKKGDFVLLYNKIKHKNYGVDDINWDDTRIIFISPKFSKYQRKASGFQGLPTELYEIKKYENEIITLDRIDADFKTSQSSKSEGKYKRLQALTEYTEDDYLEGKYETTPPSSETRRLWSMLKDTILDDFQKLEYKQKKKYGGFYSRDDNSCVCTISTTKSAINLSYAITKKNFLTESEFINHTIKGHFGVGHYRSKITSESDISKAIPYISKVYHEKVKSETVDE